MPEHDTIAALATAPGTGGIAIIRISGENAEALMHSLFVPANKNIRSFESHRMYYGHIADSGSVLDECMAVLFKSPASYTKEDVCEFHLHGGMYTVRSVLDVLFHHGARPAEPGEFTKRAFLNGRIDLSRAEAVMNLIRANSDNAMRAAVRQLDGGPAGFIRSVQQDITDVLSAVEAAIDYPDEIEMTLTVQDISEKCAYLSHRLRQACDLKEAKVLESGMDTVICGAPNAGKSSLLNALVSSDRAIVTDMPGTTRDILKESFLIHGMRINITDTAGIRDTQDGIELMGIRRAEDAVRNADVVLHLVDGSVPASREDINIHSLTESLPRITVYTKSDLPDSAREDLGPGIHISSVTGDGLDKLKEKIISFIGNQGESELTQLRHMHLALAAADALDRARSIVTETEDISLAGIDLEEALSILGEITGDNVSEKLLDTIFSRFCVGK